LRVCSEKLRKKSIKSFNAKETKESNQKSEKILRRETSKPTIIKSDVDELPVMQAKPNKNAYAIVIGVEKYRQQLPKADYADNDARIMTEYLTKVMGYPEENVVTLTGEHATKSDFQKYIEKWLPNNAEKRSSVFIYYSGHGAPNPKTGDAFLVPYDGDPTFIEETGVFPEKGFMRSSTGFRSKKSLLSLIPVFQVRAAEAFLPKVPGPLL